MVIEHRLFRNRWPYHRGFPERLVHYIAKLIDTIGCLYAYLTDFIRCLVYDYLYKVGTIRQHNADLKIRYHRPHTCWSNCIMTSSIPHQPPIQFCYSRCLKREYYNSSYVKRFCTKGRATMILAMTRVQISKFFFKFKNSNTRCSCKLIIHINVWYICNVWIFLQVYN